MILYFLPWFIQVRVRKELSLALLARGDKVTSTARARSLPELTELAEKDAATLELDVTTSLSELHAVATNAVAIYGHTDVAVNNTGYLISGVLGESTFVTTSGSLPFRLSPHPYLSQPRASLQRPEPSFGLDQSGDADQSATRTTARQRTTGSLFFAAGIVESGSTIQSNTPLGPPLRAPTRESPPWDFAACYLNLITSVRTSSQHTTAQTITSQSCVRNGKDSTVREITGLA